MYELRFLYLKFLLATVAAAAIAAFLGWTAFGQQVRVETRTQSQAALSSTSSVADARERYGNPSQTMKGAELGLPEGTACDVYELSDGVTLLCYGA